MHNFITLLQLQIRGYGLNQWLHQGKKRLLIGCTGVILLLSLAISYLVGITVALVYLNLTAYIPSVMIMIASIICLVITFMKGSSLLFGFGDFDTLLSLPISSTIIVASKVFSLYLLAFAFSLISLAPAMLIYSYQISNFWPLVTALLIVPFVPLIPMIVGITLTTVISLIAASFKHQQIIVVLLSLIGIISLLLFSFNLTNYSDSQMIHLLQESLNQAEAIYPLLLLIRVGFADNFLYLFLFIGISILLGVVFWFLLNRYYLYLNTSLSLRGKKSSFKINLLKQQKVMVSLLKKEVSLYFSSSLYVINSIIGVILFLTVAFCLPFVIDQLTEILPSGFKIQQVVPWLPYISCIFLAVTSPATAAISMEGKSYWHFATLPVSAGKIYGAKLLFSLLLFLPAVWVSCSIMILVFQSSFSASLLLFLLPTCFSLFMVTVSLKLNHRYPKFNWTSDQQIIKQGAPVLLAMLIGFASILLLIGLAFLFKQSPILILLASSLMLLISWFCWKSMRDRNIFIL